MRDRDTRFFRWYRTVPLLLMGLVLALSLGVGYLPSAVLRATLFPVNYVSQIEDSASRHGVDPYLVAAVIKCESNWDASVQSSAGAIGLMQLMPDTAQSIASMGLVDSSQYDPNDLTDPTTNIEYGSAYLAYLDDQLGSQDAVIAAYNAGLGSVQSWTAGGTGDVSDSIRYPETRFYLQRVNDAYSQYQRLYPNGLDAS